MKILMLVNWKIEYCDSKPVDKQPPDYKVKDEEYWFFRYFKKKPEVDVIDIRSFPLLESFEKNKLRFYVWQAFKAIPRLNRYDLIVSHGMQSAIVVCFWRRFFKTKAKHVVFDIGSFASASESGFSLKLMQFASKSLDGLIYHMSSQREYYQKFFPWVVDKAQFIRYGVDFEFFETKNQQKKVENPYIVCAGRNKCDWNTVVEAYKKMDRNLELHLIGGRESKFNDIKDVVQFPYLPVNEYVEQVKGALFCVLPLEPVNFSFGQMRLLQQMTLQKCVIVSDAPNIKDYIEDKRTAIAYIPFDSDDLRRKMILINDNQKLREKIASDAFYFVKSKCNEKNMASEIEEYLENVLKI